MNEFIGQQLGGVLGLARIQKETFIKAHGASEGIFGIDRVIQILKDTDLQIDALTKIIQINKLDEVAFPVSEETIHHFLVMRDLYISNKWADVVPVAEWSGFFEGIVMTRWSTIRGISEKLNGIEQSIIHNDLFLLANQASEFHYSILFDGMKYFHKIGIEKAMDKGK